MNMIVPAANSNPRKRRNNLMPEGPLRTAPAAISDDHPSPAGCDRLPRDPPAPGSPTPSALDPAQSVALFYVETQAKQARIPSILAASLPISPQPRAQEAVHPADQRPGSVLPPFGA